MATEIPVKVTVDSGSAKSSIRDLNRSLESIESSSKVAERSLSSLDRTTQLAVAAFGALTAAIGVREIVDYTARWTDLNSRLVNATGSQEAAARALDAISASARRTYSDLETTADVFIRNSMALNELGYTTNEQLKVSEALNNAMAVSGARGEQAASALDAFAKSMATGKLQGEDLNRIVENSPRLFRALAEGLGVTSQELRRMATEGKLTSDIVIPALISQMDQLRKEADAMPATISDAFIVLRNSLLEFIGSTDQALGISEALSKALVFLADNTGILVGAIGGLAVAVAALLIPLIPAATAMAVLTGGAAVVGAVAVGAALGYAAQQAGYFSKEAKKGTEEQEKQANAAKDAAAAEQRKVDAAKRLVEEQNRTLKDYFQKLQLERESIGLNQLELAIRKNISDAARALKIEESQITDSVRQRIIAETEATVARRQQEAITKVILDLDTERLGLAIADKDQREIALAIRRQELEFGRALTQQERERLTTAIQLTQQAREQAKIQEAINEYTRKQTELEKINRGLKLQSELDPMGDLRKNYDRDLEALQTLNDRKLISDQEYIRQRQELYDRFNQRVEQLELSRIEKTLMAERSGMAQTMSDQDKALLQKIGADERQQAIVRERIAFEKKSELEKAQFAIAQGATVFNALGAQNKRAFEAAKAFNIAQALMNTYAGATKALATYPWPFGLIAAAAAVAAGLAQVAQIRAQTYSGRALGGPVMNNTPYIVGESGPELFVPNTTGSIVRNGDLQGGRAVNVNFTIVANDTTGFDQLLVSRKGIIQQVISDAMLEKGKRSMV